MTSSDSALATIDLRGSNAPEAFARAMGETGLAVVSHHGLSASRTAEVYAEWQDFFDSGRAADYVAGPDGDGYFPAPRDVAASRDEKEFFHVYPTGRYPAEVSPAARDHLREGIDLARMLMGWLSEHLLDDIAMSSGEDPRHLIDRARATVLRVQRYLPRRYDAAQRSQVRALPHTDIDLVTLMPAPSGPGFELFRDGEWTAVSAAQGTLIVQAGEMLELLSNGRVTAALHRVVFDDAQGHRPRMSMPLFVHPRDDARLSRDVVAATFRADRLAQMRAAGWQPVLGGPTGREAG